MVPLLLLVVVWLVLVWWLALWSFREWRRQRREAAVWWAERSRRDALTRPDAKVKFQFTIETTYEASAEIMDWAQKQSRNLHVFIASGNQEPVEFRATFKLGKVTIEPRS
jgi:hypothetical protein